MVRALGPELSGRTIVRTRLSHDHVLKNRSRRAFLGSLRHASCIGVARRAKNAVFDLGGRRLVIQPGMTGSFHTTAEGAGREDYVVLALTLDDGRQLRYRDVRRLGRIYLMDPGEWRAFSGRIGPEPLDPALTAERLRDIFRRSRQAVKKVIMDQRRLAGVGNIYAAEALWAAGIHPARPANRLSLPRVGRLLAEIRRILGAAIEAEGTTFRDYRTASGRPGNFQLQLSVYGRAGEPCRRCGTALKGTHDIDARVTVYCGRCQR